MSHGHDTESLNVMTAKDLKVEGLKEGNGRALGPG